MQATLDAPDSVTLPKRAQVLLYRIAQEALRNVVENTPAPPTSSCGWRRSTAWRA